MNWKQEAVDKLRQLEAKETALKTIPEEIARLESAMESIRSASADGSPVRGGGSGREDMLLSNICARQELERSLKQTRLWVKAVHTALRVLQQDERRILERFYIWPEPGTAEKLANELGRDTKTIYRQKDRALQKFAMALYGVAEL